MKKTTILLLLSLCANIILAQSQTKKDTTNRKPIKIDLLEAIKGREKYNDSIPVVVEKAPQIEYDGRCRYYYDEVLDLNVYMGTEISAEYGSDDTGFVLAIMQNINLSQNEYNETFYKCGSYFCFSIVIDEQGDIISYIPMSSLGNKRKWTTPADKSIEAYTKNLKGWKPASCNGRNVATPRYFSLSMFWLEPKENDSKNME